MKDSISKTKAVAMIKALGLSASLRPTGEIRIVRPKCGEASAYYTDDVTDALDTANAMVRTPDTDTDLSLANAPELSKLNRLKNRALVESKRDDSLTPRISSEEFYSDDEMNARELLRMYASETNVREYSDESPYGRDLYTGEANRYNEFD